MGKAGTCSYVDWLQALRVFDLEGGSPYIGVKLDKPRALFYLQDKDAARKRGREEVSGLTCSTQVITTEEDTVSLRSSGTVKIIGCTVQI